MLEGSEDTLKSVDAEAQGAASSKPRIAVLPFANMSGDPEQEVFADGLTEDILTELSRRRELFVISRTSSFVYKGQATNLREVAQKLGAQYLVEGSVRKAGDRLRITVQLIDTASDSHIWAERYDRRIDDIFAIQDDITASIVATLPGRLEAAQHEVVARKKPSNLAAYECVLAAKVLHHRSTKPANREAQDLIARALVLDPDYGHAHAWRGCILGQAWTYGWYEDERATYNDLVRELKLAQSLDENDADTQRILGAIAIIEDDLPRAQIHHDRAYALNPNYDLIVVQMGELFTWTGRPQEGIEWIKRAMTLNPHHPLRFWSHLGRAYFTAKQYMPAIEAYMRITVRDAAQQAYVAASYGWLGDETASRAHAAKVRELDPDFTIESFVALQHYGQESDRQHLREGLMRAGLV
jgi:adenylate cyclase